MIRHSVPSRFTLLLFYHTFSQYCGFLSIFVYNINTILTFQGVLYSSLINKMAEINKLFRVGTAFFGTLYWKKNAFNKAYYRFFKTILMKFRYFPPPASIAFRSPTAYSLSCLSQSAQTSSLDSISVTEMTSAPLQRLTRSAQ